MTTVRTSCPGCGDVELAAAGIVVLAYPGQAASQYRFRCPSCDCVATLPIAAPLADLLVCAGSKVTLVLRSPELEEHHLGPPLTPDDVEGFVDHLHMSGWLEDRVGGAER